MTGRVKAGFGAVLGLSAAIGLAEPQPGDTVSDGIASYATGIICAVEPDRIDAAPGTVSGTKHVVHDAPDFVANSRQVPAVLGVGFGITAMAAPTEGITGTMVVTHPPFAGTGATVQSFPSFVPSGEAGITFYQFDYEYELAIGEWTLTFVADDGVPVYSIDFDVVDPARLPDLADACGYADLLS